MDNPEKDSSSAEEENNPSVDPSVDEDDYQSKDADSSPEEDTETIVPSDPENNQSVDEEDDHSNDNPSVHEDDQSKDAYSSAEEDKEKVVPPDPENNPENNQSVDEDDADPENTKDAYSSAEEDKEKVVPPDPENNPENNQSVDEDDADQENNESVDENDDAEQEDIVEDKAPPHPEIEKEKPVFNDDQDDHEHIDNPEKKQDIETIVEEKDQDEHPPDPGIGIGIGETNTVFTKVEQPDTEEQSDTEEQEEDGEEFHETNQIIEENPYLSSDTEEEDDDSDNPSQKHKEEEDEAEKNVEHPYLSSEGIGPHYLRASWSIEEQSEINPADSPEKEQVTIDIQGLKNLEEIKEEKPATTDVHTTIVQSVKSNRAKLVKIAKKVFARYWLAVVFILLEIGIFAVEQMSAQPPQTPPIIYWYKIASVILSLISFGLAAWDSLMMQRRGERWLFSLTFLGFVFSTLGALMTCLQFWRMQWYNEPLWLKVSPVTFAFAVIVLASQIWG